MHDGNVKMVKDIRKGDYIMSINNKKAKVECLVKFNCYNGQENLCTLENGLKITRKHPILHNGNWIYPKTITNPTFEKCEAVYNMVVSSEHIAIINNTPVILLGHNYTHGILKDNYLGSEKVRNDLKKM
jgi:hypothetical protein